MSNLQIFAKTVSPSNLFDRGEIKLTGDVTNGFSFSEQLQGQVVADLNMQGNSESLMSPVKTKFTTSLLKLPFFLSNGAIRLKKQHFAQPEIYTTDHSTKQDLDVT